MSNKLKMRKYSTKNKQSGAVLIIGLMMLAVITIIGLVGMRGTIAQFFITSGFHDRRIALEGAEAALNVGEEEIGNLKIIPFNSSCVPSSSTFCVRDCSPKSGNVCLSNPFEDANSKKYIKTVSSDKYNPGLSAVGQPQYIVQYLGEFIDSDIKTMQLSNNFNYGGKGGSLMLNYYSVTARSANSQDRSVVTLQSVVKY